jgi:hypothetical protein
MLSNEFTAPELVNNYVTAQLLTNITPGSIMLQVQNTINTDQITSTVVQFLDSETQFYNNIVISDEASPVYNEDIIQSYINNGVLSTSTITPTSPTGYIYGLPNSTHTINIQNNKLVKQNPTNKIDGLEIYYSLSLTNSLQIIVYKSTKGFYYSLDTGTTIIPIPTNGMMYPNEVTSIAIQNVSSVTTPGYITIWAGTLQEGLLSYTLNSSSWVSQSDKELSLSNNNLYLFRHTLQYNLETTPADTTVTTYTPQGYAPVYILGIINSPIEAGLPLLVYTKTILTTINATLDGTNPLAQPVIGTTTTAKHINTVYKYLSPNYIFYTLDTKYNIYRPSIQTTVPLLPVSNISTVTSLPSIPNPAYPIGSLVFLSTVPNAVYRNSGNFWLSNPTIGKVSLSTVSVLPTLPNGNYTLGYILTLSTNNAEYVNIANVWVTSTLPVTPGYSWTAFINPFSNELCDILKIIPYTTQANFNTFSSSQLITVAATYSNSLTEYIVEILYLSVANDLNASPRRQITITKDTSIGNTIVINPNYFSGISSYNNDIFLTTRNQIYRFTNNAWTSWLLASDIVTPERNTAITTNYSFSLTNPISYISGLRGFGVVQNPTNNNNYYGILNTDLGYILFNLIKTTSDYITPITNSKTLRTDLFGTSVRDLQVIPEISSSISCGLIDEPVTKYILPLTLGSPTRYFNYSPQILSNLPSGINYLYSQVFYKNYTISGIAILPYLVNRFNDFNLSSVNEDQLYINQNNLASVGVLKDITAQFSYIDSYNFNWLDNITASYVTKTLKYNKLKFLLQTVQTITDIDATLSSNLEIRFIPDIDF